MHVSYSRFQQEKKSQHLILPSYTTQKDIPYKLINADKASGDTKGAASLVSSSTHLQADIAELSAEDKQAFPWISDLLIQNTSQLATPQ